MVEEAIDERDVVAIVTPLFHVAALNIMFQPGDAGWRSTVFMHALDRRRPSWTMRRADWHHRGFHGADPGKHAGARPRYSMPPAYAHGESCPLPGAPMPDWVQRELKAKLPNLLADADLRSVGNGRDRRAARLVSAGEARRGRASTL